MRKILTTVAVLYSAAALAQGTPPMVGDKPLKQVKPKSEVSTKGGAPKSKSVATGLLGCLDIDDGTKGRLDCYDTVVSPKPKPKPPAVKGVLDCRYLKEEDERLTCFNGFAEKIPKFS
jgi:hypothetical protein